MPKKVSHDFKGRPTVAAMRPVVAGEWLDSPNVPAGTGLYIRKVGVGCWIPARIVIEDSGVYIEAGEESNPQAEPVDGEIVES